MNDTVIQVANLSKRYRLGVIGTGTLSHDLNRWWAKARGRPDPTLKVGQAAAGSRQLPVGGDRLPSSGATTSNLQPPTPDYMWALKDLSFEVRRGEILGIIGLNGAGKSTVLKILSRVTAPTSGEVRVRGRIASLLEIGTGFHPELTGRENILFNGAILGMRKAEIARRFDEIVAFSEVEKYIDTPVKRYSSGMYVRLAFAVAAHLDPEILIVDEVLAVGDAAFQNKCLNTMGDAASGGRTVLFVSHNMKAVSGLCSRAILLDRGELVFAGSTAETVDVYNRRSSHQVEKSDGSFDYPDDREAPAHVTRIRLLDTRGRPGLRHDVLEPIDVEIDFVLRQGFPTLLLCCEVRLMDGTLAFQTIQSDWQNYVGPGKTNEFPMKPGRYKATIHMPAPLLNAGVYELEVYLTTGPCRQDTRKGIALEVVDHDSYVSYHNKDVRGGVVAPPVPWDVRRIGDVGVDDSADAEARPTIE